METNSLSGFKDIHPPEYSGVIAIKKTEKIIQTIAKRNHFRKIILLTKNSIMETIKIARKIWNMVLVIKMLFPPKHRLNLKLQGPT